MVGAKTTDSDWLGVDIGASLAKIVRCNPEGTTHRSLLNSTQVPELSTVLTRHPPTQIGLTGGGALAWSQRIGPENTLINEFHACRLGAESLLAQVGRQPQCPYLLISMGTGTSILRVEETRIERAGGTALGGGTLMGLASRLLERPSFPELVRLAERGQRDRADLLIGDVYDAHGFEEVGLSYELTAANLGKLANTDQEIGREDVAQALMGLVGENLGLIAGHIAARFRISRTIFIGSPFRENPCLAKILLAVTHRFDLDAEILEGGEFAGAQGALLAARDKLTTQGD